MSKIIPSPSTLIPGAMIEYRYDDTGWQKAIILEVERDDNDGENTPPDMGDMRLWFYTDPETDKRHIMRERVRDALAESRVRILVKDITKYMNALEMIAAVN